MQHQEIQALTRLKTVTNYLKQKIMKTILSFLFIAFSFAAFAQTGGMPEFAVTTHSFGKIKQGVPVTTEFKFVNKGSKPLIVQDAKAECGCTTPEFTKTPIAKNKEGKITVTYNAESPGAFTKKVTVTFVGIKDPVILIISGEVETP